jgi:ADP-heptose:LPS heptosyltransferase
MSILVLRALGIGDLCAGVPALRALRRAFPTERLVLAAPQWLAPLAALTGSVDDLAVVPSLETEIPAVEREPRIAVNLHGKGPRSHRLLQAAHPGRLLAFACPEAEFSDGPQFAEREHEVARWCRLLTWYGLAADPDPAELALLEPAAPPAVKGATVVHPGAKAPARRWPAERFATVARALVADGHDVVVTGSAEDVEPAARIAEGSGARSLAGTTDVGELAALIAAARLVICGDTGVAHLASAYAVPSVLLFGPMDPALWGPPPRRRHQVLWHPGARHPETAMMAITPDEVLDAVIRAQVSR